MTDAVSFARCPYEMQVEHDGVALEFPAFPEIACFVPSQDGEGIDPGRLQAYGQDAVIAALKGRIEHRQPIPRGDPDAAQAVVVPFIAQMKLVLYAALLARGLSNRQFAKRLGKNEANVRRLLDLDHNSAYRSLAAALDALGVAHREKVEVLEPRAA